MTAGAASVSSDALLLKSNDYRDADRILTLLTERFGVVSAIARGARGSRRRFAGALEPYGVIRLELGPLRGELYPLESATLVRSFPALLTDLARMDVAGAGLSFLRAALPVAVANPAVFVAAVQLLTVLELHPDPERATLLAFVTYVLAQSGLGARLSVCGRSGEPVPSHKAAYFDPTLGTAVARRFGGGPYLLSAEARRRLQAAQGPRWALDALAPWAEQDLRVARAAVAAQIAHHLSPEVAARLFPGAL